MPSIRLHGPLFTHRHRYTQIVRILSRHGLGWLAEQLGISALIPFERGILARRGGARLSQPAHLRMALEELGTTFIKLGQILSTREDLLPPAYIAELSKLRDEVSPVPSGAILRQIEQSLGRPIEELFSDFDPIPLATASIGQVHAARLPGGTPVIVKVQKPGVPAQVEEDLAILREFARFAQRRAPLAEAYDLFELVDEFSWTLRGELDYLREARNAEQFGHLLEEHHDIVVPKIYWQRTSQRVITQQRIDGIPIDAVDELDEEGIDRRQLAVNAAQLVLEEVFVHRMFHADPHPGNFAVLPDGKLVAYDFGMVGRIDDSTRDALLSLMTAIGQRDAETVVDSLANLFILRHGSDREGLRRDIQHLLDRYYGLSLQEYYFDVIFHDIMSLIRRRRLQLPAELMLLMKTLAMYEGVGRRLDPDFQPFEVAVPYVKRAMMERFFPSNWGPRLILTADDAYRFITSFPRRAHRLLTRAEQGDLEIAMRIIGLEEIVRQVQQMVSRLVAAILFGVGLLALSLLLVIYHPSWMIHWVAPFVGAGATIAILIALAHAIRQWLRSNPG